MAEWITTANGLITLITGLVGLIGTGIGAYFAVKNWITVLKTKSSQEIWAMIMEMADAAMTEAEKSGKSGADKKQMVIESVKASCRAAGVNLDVFIDQLSNYIDNTIKFANNLKK
jgi:3-hydroxyacyl-CoA dehydrogenase